MTWNDLWLVPLVFYLTGLAACLAIFAYTGITAWRRRKPAGPDLSRCIRREGKLLAILRPSDPERALRRARGKVKAVRGKPGLSALLCDPKQAYTFIGLPTTDGHIVDPLTGENLGRTHAGDSFVDYELLETAIKKDEATP